ncbi:zinc finger protein 362 isoform X1 [Oncorhynchus mykiss]|uniref:C2H2-type domain-containing protein n=1 Tax=Oncorhynchus mykiss TaxID=8022 RepID=A0A8C7VQM3_ONCMY|nr:zinc finger protein 362 isoform X1 [Oncorhynchus mykiss]XP_035595319.1 zinc finger protein 362-like isoform X1 [Oncorhynchus keta]
MAEPRFNNPYFWPPPPSMPSQLDNLVLINKIKEQLMAEKIRPLHLPTNSAPSQQTLLVASSPLDGGQHSMLMPKSQQGQHHPQGSVQQPDIALHARTASSSVPEVNMDDKSAVKVKGLWDEWHMRQIVEQPSRVNHRSVFMCPYTGLAPMSRPDSHSTSEALTPTSSSQNRLGGTPSVNIISGLASGPGMEQMKSGGLAGLLGPPPKTPRGRKKIKAESGGPLLVVPYPIMASGADQGCITFPAKEGKTYRCKVCPLTFMSKSEMQIHSKSHTEAKPHKCPHCSKSFANASYLAQHLRIHLGIKPYHCSYCENSFRQLSHLQQHTRIHTGDRPYKCAAPGCEKAFTQLSNLQSHQRQHNKDKPYKCPNCYRAYSDSASLQIHLSAHAIKNAKAYCCNMCGRAYTSETYLMKHMSKHTVVEHLVSHQSPQRTESPSIPIRISLI